MKPTITEAATRLNEVICTAKETLSRAGRAKALLTEIHKAEVDFMLIRETIVRLERRVAHPQVNAHRKALAATALTHQQTRLPVAEAALEKAEQEFLLAV